MTITTTSRPYVLHSGGMTYPLTSAEAQHLIDDAVIGHAHDLQDEITEVFPNRVTLETPSGSRYSILPATLGGGAAFVIVR